MNIKLRNVWQENKQFVLFLALMFFFRSAIADWNEVPTGSMKPTIIEGDRIWVDKLAYDVRVPFTNISLYHRADPVVGDIVIFESAAAGKRLVKRVIGVPGDQIVMVDNRLVINGNPLQYDDGKAPTQHTPELAEHNRLSEALKGKPHEVFVAQSQSMMSNFGPVEVPKGHYLVLGDNRDHSADSRVIGFVPRDEIIGKTETVVLSLNYDNFYLPRWGRFLETI
ncbi:signal peptidase I [Marinibactrum halimedae]|uniref:Signal peptidase I n=1 Tax=Marinibactrum halimedae TaxID=1444977 RepID=A0AA37T3I7_9GAMM|nr:signal peptidase I [Marinibactrum halimedae]MCD9458617.1 signal peptidase I [Marinibactrum halimedae]GLS26018.1 signal peptidase I [Marinibactrum halimedae]